MKAVAHPPGGRSEALMNLTLNDHEATLLAEFLETHLPDLRREVARTDQHEMRHRLVQRQELAEKLLEQLHAHAA